MISNVDHSETFPVGRIPRETKKQKKKYLLPG